VQGIVEVLDVADQTTVLGHAAVACLWQNALIGLPVISVAGGALSVARWYLLPQSLCAGWTAVTDMDGHDFPGLEILGQPEPHLVTALPDKASHLVALEGQASFFSRYLCCVRLLGIALIHIVL